MKNIGILLGAATLAAIFTGCDYINDDWHGRDREKIVEMTIMPETGYKPVMMMSDLVRDVLLFTDSDVDPHQSYTHIQSLSDILTEGFDFEYERGYTYTFTVKKVWMANPPSDVSNVKYIFYGPLRKEKTITEDSELEMQVSVTGKVDYAPRFPAEFNNDGSLKIYEALAVRHGSEYSSRLSMPTGGYRQGNFMALKQIEGWEYEPGYVHLLKIRKITTAEPYSVRYVLVEALDKQPK